MPEGKTVKNRLHLDLVAADWETEIGRLTDLGATRIGEVQENGAHWITLADPEGNEFDLVHGRPSTHQQEGRAVTKEIKVPDANHPISIDAGTVRVVARGGDTVIADTNAALTLREAHAEDVLDLAETQFAMARVLGELHHDPVRARDLAHKAREKYVARRDTQANFATLADIDAWLARAP